MLLELCDTAEIAIAETAIAETAITILHTPSP